MCTPVLPMNPAFTFRRSEITRIRVSIMTVLGSILQFGNFDYPTANGLPLTRLNGFPSTARWTEGANFTPLYISDRDVTVPLFLWALGNHVLTYNPDNRRSTWRTLELPADPPERRHDGFFSLGTIRLPLTSSNAVVFSSSFMLLEDPRSPSGKSMGSMG